jgi:hypothetical protein
MVMDAEVVRSSCWLDSWPPSWPSLELWEEELPPWPPTLIPKNDPLPPAWVDDVEPWYQLLAKLELCELALLWVSSDETVIVA